MKSFVALYLSFMLLITTIAGFTGNLVQKNKGPSGDFPSEVSEGLDFALNDDGYSYSVCGIGWCSDEMLVIPSEYQGFPVTGITSWAFSYCDTFTEVYIPSNITSIGESAFYCCTNLEHVVYYYGVERIEYGTFTGCYNLSTVTLTDSIKYIDSSAFNECGNLSYNYDSGVKYLGTGDNDHYALIGVEDTSKESYSIHKKTVLIAEGAFMECAYVEKLSVPDKVQYINDLAFSYCYALRKISLGDNVSEIGYGAFINCYDLQDIEFPDGVKEIPEACFVSCYNLTEITLPSSLNYIAQDAFSTGAADTMHFYYNGTSSSWYNNVTLANWWIDLSGSAVINCSDAMLYDYYN